MSISDGRRVTLCDDRVGEIYDFAILNIASQCLLQNPLQQRFQMQPSSLSDRFRVSKRPTKSILEAQMRARR